VYRAAALYVGSGATTIRQSLYKTIFITWWYTKGICCRIFVMYTLTSIICTYVTYAGNRMLLVCVWDSHHLNKSYEENSLSTIPFVVPKRFQPCHSDVNSTRV